MENLTGKILTSCSGKKYFLASIIGEGAQGVIYRTEDEESVIKLYKTGSELSNKRRLRKLEWLTRINYPDQFIKPYDIFDSPYIGYAMKNVQGHISLNKLLVPSREMSVSEWYNGATGGLYRRLLIGQKIATQFAKLHRMNMAYCDLSGNNILVNENKSINSVCMIDIDNIYIPGAEESNILGTSRYMAPEIINRQINPDIFTDSYSLAVILFELLKIGHPYIGDIIEDGTPGQMTAAYRGLYPYVEDPENDMNRSSQMLPSNVVFTTPIKKLFEKTFVDGKDNRLNRIRAQEFATAFQKASNLLVKCSSCGCWHYARANDNHEYECPWCDAPYEKPMRIAFCERYNCKLNGKSIPLQDNHIEDFILKDDFILKERAVNIITKNYIRNSYEDENSNSSDECFSVRLSKDGKFCIINTTGQLLSIRKAGTEKDIPVKKNEYQIIEKGDYLFFDDTRKMEQVAFDSNLKGIAFKFAVVK